MFAANSVLGRVLTVTFFAEAPSRRKSEASEEDFPNP